MLSKCANPACAAPFQYLREGRLYAFEADAEIDGLKRPIKKVEHFWLCGDCALTMTLAREPHQKDVIVVPLRNQTNLRRAAAS